MNRFSGWLSRHSFSLYSLAFLLMTLAPIGLYFSAQERSNGWTLFLLALVGLANTLVLFLR